ncbi:MAG: oligoribonuclease [Candidatus Babeliales bacterium]
MQKKEYPRGNFVWIDLEMTGLNIETEHILEIATIITDDQLNILDEGPNLVIHQPDNILMNMSPWCLEQHGKTGLIRASQDSTTTVEDAAEQTLMFIQLYCPRNTGILAGSSIWQDRIFLSKYMPGIVEYLYYKQIDVSSVKELITRWYPNDPDANTTKKDAHRALDDIRESIELLKQLRKHFFI